METENKTNKLSFFFAAVETRGFNHLPIIEEKINKFYSDYHLQVDNIVTYQLLFLFLFG